MYIYIYKYMIQYDYVCVWVIALLKYIEILYQRTFRTSCWPSLGKICNSTFATQFLKDCPKLISTRPPIMAAAAAHA